MRKNMSRSINKHNKSRTSLDLDLIKPFTIHLTSNDVLHSNKSRPTTNDISQERDNHYMHQYPGLAMMSIEEREDFMKMVKESI